MLGAGLYFLWDSDFSQWIYGLTKLTLVLWPLLWLKAFKEFVPRGKSIGGEGWGLLSGLIFAGIIYGVFWTGLLPELGGIQEKAAAFGLLSPMKYILFSIFLSLFHALLEEYYWRWFVFKGLQIKLSWIPAAVLSSAAFAGHHYFVLSEFFPLGLTLLFGTMVGVAGFFWCFLYKKTDSLWAPYLSHVLVDAVLMLIGYTILF